jgi:hypothetical protein
MHSNRPGGCDHDPEDQEPGTAPNEAPAGEPGKWATIREAIARWGPTTRLATILLVIEAPVLIAVLPQAHANVAPARTVAPVVQCPAAPSI